MSRQRQPSPSPAVKLAPAVVVLSVPSHCLQLERLFLFKCRSISKQPWTRALGSNQGLQLDGIVHFDGAAFLENYQRVVSRRDIPFCDVMTYGFGHHSLRSVRSNDIYF